MIAVFYKFVFGFVVGFRVGVELPSVIECRGSFSFEQVSFWFLVFGFLAKFTHFVAVLFFIGQYFFGQVNKIVAVGFFMVSM